jgi:activating signal cointegrator 1
MGAGKPGTVGEQKESGGGKEAVAEVVGEGDLMLMIPTITLWQPWASLIALGEKKIETRSWPVHKNYRGPLAIHASAKVPGWARELWGQEPFLSALKEQATVPVGAIIAVCNLTDCVRITREYRYTLTDQELAFGDYTPGRYAWILKDVHVLKAPIQIKGRQGLWSWDATPHLVTIDPYMIGQTKIWTPSGIRQGKIVNPDREDAVSGLEVVA